MSRARRSGIDGTRLRAIEVELGTLRPGAPAALGIVMPAIRELLGTDNAVAYAVADHGRGWQLDWWHCDGDAAAFEPGFRRLFATTERAVFYDPGAPAPWMRNRVIEAIAWIDRDVPGTWRASPLCREVAAACGMADHEHLRALICDGPALLGWFGTLVPGTPDPRQRRLLQALVPAVRRRLVIERRLELAATAERALAVALERIGAPAFVVRAGGAILEANAAARAELETRRSEVVTALADALAGRGPVELTPIVTRGEPTAWLAVMSAAASDARRLHATGAAAVRWGLTPRQGEVLARVVDGEPTVTIAGALGISERAIEMHLTALFDRAGVDNRAALVARVLLDR